MSPRSFRILANACVAIVLLGVAAALIYWKYAGGSDSPGVSGNPAAAGPKSTPAVMEDPRPRPRSILAQFQRRVNNPANLVEVRVDGSAVLLDPAARRELLDRLNAALERASVEAIPAPASQPRPAVTLEVFYRESLGRVERAALRAWDSPGRIELRVADDVELRPYRCVAESTQFVLWLQNAPKRK